MIADTKRRQVHPHNWPSPRQRIVKQLPLTPLPMRVLRILALVLVVLSLGLSNWPAWNLAAGLAPGPVSAGRTLAVLRSTRSASPSVHVL